MAGKFECYKDKAGEHRFRLKAGNGETILSSEGYSSKTNCDNVLCADVKRSSARATGWPRVRRPATSLHDFSRRSSAQTG